MEHTPYKATMRRFRVREALIVHFTRHTLDTIENSLLAIEVFKAQRKKVVDYESYKQAETR